MKSEAEEVAQATAEHRVNFANGDLERAEGVPATGEHGVVADPDLVNGDLEGGYRARAAGENQINGTDAVRGNRNVDGRAMSRNLIRRILYHAGPVILVISTVLLISIPLGLHFRLQIFVGFCGIFVGMMLVFLAVYLS